MPLMLSENLEPQIEPIEVIAVHNKSAEGAEVPIKWKNLPDFEATREPFDTLIKQFPHFHLEDKVKLLGTSIVSNRPTITRVYVRRGRKERDFGPKTSRIH